MLVEAAQRSRARRWEWLAARYPLPEMTVLDLGGLPSFWAGCCARPRRLVCLNLPNALAGVTAPGWIELVEGDACEPPDLGRFDLVVSNSVIEHLGGHYRRAQFAEAVHRFGDRYWIQTPAATFPLEAHSFFPGFPLLPLCWQVRVAQSWPFGSYAAARHRRPDRKIAERLLSTDYLTAFELRHYFPGCEIVRERVGPLTKSLIACR